MSQNIYDDESFFAAYAQLPRSVDGLDGAGEWPRLRTLLPPMEGARVLDLGCGYGWFCRWAGEAGAAEVVGIDVSERMLQRAASTTNDDGISYRRADLDEVRLTPNSADLVYSSLTLHYLRDLPRLFDEVAAALAPGGTFVCSVEHPTYTAPTNPVWRQGDDGVTVWPLHGYSREGERITNWLADGVRKQHRTIETYVTTLLASGLRLTRLVEWSPSDADVHAHPEWGAERDRCPFLFLAATKPLSS
jgi:SAM-dependent methyltransferase